MSESFEKLVHLTELHLRGLRETDPRILNLAAAELSVRSPDKKSVPRPAPAAPVAATAPKAPVAVHESADAAARLKAIAAEIAVCTKCPLHRTRTKTVPGQGASKPQIVFIGEGPGRDEDAQGLAFIGRAGELLTRLIGRMGLTRDEVFIGNIVKCRPTVNGEGTRDRPPEEAEMEACLPYLRAQLQALHPRVIVTLGNIPLGALTGKKGITHVRGQWLEFDSIPLMPTYHPSFLLRGGGEDKARWWEVWDDMCEVLKRLSLPIPEAATKRPGAR